jgi:glycine/D-amino acid oxidase-like deaminating enzyme
LQSAQWFFSLPCGQPRQSAQLLFRLPCGQGLQAAQLPFTLPCGQRLRVFPIPYHPPLLERRLPQGIPANPLITSSEVRLEKMLPRTSRYSRKSGRPTFAKTAELQPESRRFSSDWFPTDMSSCHEEFFRETAAQRLPGLSERLASPGDTRRSASETSPDELPRRGARPFAPSRLPPRPSP